METPTEQAPLVPKNDTHKCICTILKLFRVAFSPRVRALWVVCIALALDFGMFDLLVPLLPAYEESLNLSETQIGLFVGIYSLAALVVVFPVGFLADRIGHASVWMTVSTGMLTLATVGFALTNSYPALMVARCIQGFASGVSWTVAITYLAPPFKDNFASVIGGSEAASLIGSLIAPAFSGWLFEVGGSVFLPCICAAGMCLCATLLQLCLPSFKELQAKDQLPVNEPDKSPKRSRLELIDLLKEPLTWSCYICNALFMLQMGFSYTVLPLYMTDTLGMR